MGSQQSRDGGVHNGGHDDGDGHSDDRMTNPCQPCLFFFNSPFARDRGDGGTARARKGRNDHLGSPLPDTPVAVRQQRKQAAAKVAGGSRNNGIGSQRDNPVFSSKYGGLEKEVSSSSSSARAGKNNSNNISIGKNNGNSSNGTKKSTTRDTLDALDEQDGNSMYAAEVYEGKVSA